MRTLCPSAANALGRLPATSATPPSLANGATSVAMNRMLRLGCAGIVPSSVVRHQLGARATAPGWVEASGSAPAARSGIHIDDDVTAHVALHNLACERGNLSQPRDARRPLQNLVWQRLRQSRPGGTAHIEGHGQRVDAQQVDAT